MIYQNFSHSLYRVSVKLGINPTGGGVSQITHVLANEFQKHRLNVNYLGFQAVEGIKYPHNQFFLPNSNILICKENIYYLNVFCKDYHIDVIVNQNGLLLDSVEFVANAKRVFTISVIHNCIFTQYRNLAYQYEYQLKSFHLGLFFNVLRGFPLRNTISSIYIRKYAHYYNQIADNSDAVSVMSEGQINDLKIVLNKKKWSKLFFIPNCINPYTLQWKPRSKTVLWVATIDFKIKRVDLMLRIWKLVQDSHPDWTLKILGDSSFTEQAKNYARQVGVNNVNFEGRVNPESYYLDAQIACVTSTHESFSMVIIESFKYGVVPFAFDSFPASTEIINNGIDGIVIPAFNVEEYARQLSALMGDKDRREKMRLQSYESAKKYYSSKIYCEWESLLEKSHFEKYNNNDKSI